MSTESAAQSRGEPATGRSRLIALGILLGAVVALGALLIVPTQKPFLLRLEHQTADARTMWFADKAPAGGHPQITLIMISDETLKDYPTSSPIDRGLTAKLIEGLDAAGAKAIGVDILFLRATDAAKDEALKAAIRAAKAPVIMGALDERGDLRPFQKEFQSKFLAEVGRPAGFLNLRWEADTVVRYMAGSHPGSQFPVSFPEQILKSSGSTADASGRRIAWLAARDKSTPFPEIPAQNLVKSPTAPFAISEADARLVKGRIVLIGGDFALRDRHRTPLSVFGAEPMAGVAIHANVVAEHLDGRSIIELSPYTANVLSLGLAGVGFLLGWLVARSNWLGWQTGTIALLIVDAIVFSQLRVILPFTLGLAAWFIGVTAGRQFRKLRPPQGSLAGSTK